jgi:hypothetical protein
MDDQNDAEKIRRTLRSLLTEYPLCFGYWKRWAAHEKRIAEEATTQAGGTTSDVTTAGYQRSMEVLEQGLRHTSSSIRLWQQFVDEVATGPMPADHIRGYTHTHTHTHTHDIYGIHKMIPCIAACHVWNGCNDHYLFVSVSSVVHSLFIHYLQFNHSLASLLPSKLSFLCPFVFIHYYSFTTHARTDGPTPQQASYSFGKWY